MKVESVFLLCYEPKAEGPHIMREKFMEVEGANKTARSDQSLSITGSANSLARLSDSHMRSSREGSKK